MKTRVVFSLPPGPLQIGLIEADGVRVGPSRPAYLERISAEVAPILAPEWIFPDNYQKGIRSLLKAYGFHPSGRNRPASEFLVKDLLGRGAFNPINNVVDINNHLSLTTHLPISIFDRAKAGDDLILRVGIEGEQYVFNREGQELSLKHLLLVARHDTTPAGTPVGSPVKDSQATKVFEDTSSITGVVYSSQSLLTGAALAEVMTRFATLLREEAMATDVEWKILDGPQ